MWHSGDRSARQGNLKLRVPRSGASAPCRAAASAGPRKLCAPSQPVACRECKGRASLRLGRTGDGTGGGAGAAASSPRRRHQDTKAGLCEMPIWSRGLGGPMVQHNLHAQTIGHAPGLVCMGSVASLRTMDEPWTQSHDGPATTPLPQPLVPRGRQRSQRTAREEIPKLDQHGICRDERLSTPSPTSGQRLGLQVKCVPSIEEGHQVARIHQNGRVSHDLCHTDTRRRSGFRRCARHHRHLPLPDRRATHLGYYYWARCRAQQGR